LTVIEISTVALPPVFDAVTVNVAAARSTEGVPEITPVAGFRVSPCGSAGETLYAVTAPPELVGVFPGIGTPLVYTAVGEEYASPVGGASFTVIEIAAVVLPPEFDAVTVYVAAGATAIGVPEITPDVALRASPEGSGGQTVNPATAPPPLVGVFAPMATPLV
jgi:hypothetical protein